MDGDGKIDEWIEGTGSVVPDRVAYLSAIVIYALPAFALPFDVPVPYRIAIWLFIPLGLVGFGVIARKEYDPAPEPNLDRVVSSDTDVIVAAYTELGEEFRYRDRLLLHATYFSFAIVAVLINIYFRVQPAFRPAIALMGSLLAFGFAVAITSQRGSRDQIREARGLLDETDPLDAVITVSDVGTIRERPFLSNFSAGTYIENLHVVIFVGWTITYAWVALNAATGFELFPYFEFLPQVLGS